MKTELRVHGVSGTPARNMLYTDPVERRDRATARKSRVSVWKQPVHPGDAGYQIEAFHWGGLTSGRWYTAFWILFAPFMLANVAGWMARRTGFLGATLLRLAGLGITGLFVAQAVTALVALPAGLESCILNICDRSESVGVLVALVGLGYWFIVTFFVVQRDEPDGDDDDRPRYRTRVRNAVAPSGESRLEPGDPARTLSDRRITSCKFRRKHRLVLGLQACHLGFGLAVIAVSAAAVAGGSFGGLGTMTNSAFTFGVVGVVLIAVIVTLLEVGPSWLSNAAFWLGLVPFGVSIAAVGQSDESAWQPVQAHEVVMAVSLLLAICALLVGWRCGWRSMGAIALAAQLGGVLGIAIALSVEEALSVDPANGVVAHGAGWVSVAMVLMIEVLLLCACFNVGRKEPPGMTVGAGWLGLLRRVALRGAGYLKVAAYVGLFSFIAAGIYVLCERSLKLPDPNTPVAGRLLIGGAILVSLAAPTAVLKSRLVRWPAVFAVGAAAALVVVAAGWILHTWPKLDGAVEVATVVGVLIPGSFLLNSVWKGLRQGTESRRRVGILWDLGSFWPRWFHPLAPPDYGAYAVSSLITELEDHPRDVVAGHSQGSIVAAMALHHGHISAGLVSYGSPLGWLYPQLFPTAGFDDLVASVHGNHKWINVWRNTDPIGGQPVAFLKRVGNRRAGKPPGHSSYERTGAFLHARDAVTDP